MKNKKKGFTFVEILVVVGVLGVITGSIMMVVVSWQRSWNISKVQMDIQSQARQAMSVITEELSQTSQDKVSINITRDVITFQLPNDDYAAGAFTWGDQIQYSLILEPTNISQLLRTNLTTGQTEILASYISEMWFTLANGLVSMQLTVEKIPKGETEPIPIQLDSQVSLRNL